MPTITCQYTGIQFEASSKRQKNHPLVSELLNSASRDKHNPSRYSDTLRALAKAKAQGMTDISAVLAFVSSEVAGDIDHANQIRVASAEAKRQQDRAQGAPGDEAKQRRAETNAFLRQHGYTWSKEYADRDEYESGDDPSVWVLRAPDGIAMPVSQALDEIARGRDVVRAEVAEREAKAAAEVAAQEAAKQGEQAREQAEVAAFDAARDAAIAGMALVQGRGIVLDELEIVARCFVGMRRYLRTGMVNGVAVAVVARYSYDSDDFFCYCADPAAAGLVPIAKPEPGSLDETYARFFGETKD